VLRTQSLVNWQHFDRVPAWVLPYQYRGWVLDNGSLTKRLVDASHGNFAVRVTFQGWDYPQVDERRALNIPCRKKALIREVELLCYGNVWVRARSIIPAATLSGDERQLKSLGNRPLGAFLFRSKAMKRSKLEVASFLSTDRQTIYGRRSVFTLHGKPLLVSELFMPELLDRKNTDDFRKLSPAGQ